MTHKLFNVIQTLLAVVQYGPYVWNAADMFFALNV